MAADRLSLVTGHLTSTFPAGLLADQTAIITGAGQGIGAATALLFAKEGARVVVADLDETKAREVAAAITAAGGKAVAVAGDIMLQATIDAVVNAAVQLGEGKIHHIVNNAGFTWDGVIHKTTDKQWDMIMDLHTKAPFRLVRAAAPYFRVKDGEPRSITNVSSTSGIHGNAGQANYATAKMGILGLTKTIAKEWGPSFGVRCNAVAFGSVTTRLTAEKESGAFAEVGGEKIALGIPKAQQRGAEGFAMVPLRRAGTANEAAMSILMLASPLSAYVSGHCLEVTGGAGI
ncbi:hypothetical protein BZA05DRAFT_381618 [Tricharina praecox]|uniref:uncharacterized protein n=1 Tax=Tricharina praecox TaxID=43433 RepID=UPI00221E8DA9|nr:uncharacterized protein BZA05DRAFT_381618 [Tricharina praecox]KAI5858552.1 hypothetical protein BZA05DRAFT_381618 [Tricharina praecox]